MLKIKISVLFAAASFFVVSTTTAALAKTLTFNKTCHARERITIAAVGDLIFHKRLLLKAFHRRQGFKQFWKPMTHVLQSADLTYGNLEGPVAQDVRAGGRKTRDPGWRLDYRVYGYRLPNVSFNFHPAVVDDLKDSGFDIVSTANNHVLDRGALGIDRTIENFERVGLAFTGTRKRTDVSRSWSTLTKSKSFTVAWLACTYSTNGIPDRKDQTLRCFRQRDEVLLEIKRLRERSDVDAIILTPHWGVENSHRPIRRQRKLARDAIEAGATAVIGAHPHVLQPWEKHTTEQGRDGLIIYSLGNFISNQRRQPQRVGAVALLELSRTQDDKVLLSGAGYIPTWAQIDRRGWRAAEARKKSYAARHARRIFPSGNRVTSRTFRQLPNSCPDTATVTAQQKIPLDKP